jgi:hypothetical protein
VPQQLGGPDALRVHDRPHPRLEARLAGQGAAGRAFDLEDIISAHTESDPAPGHPDRSGRDVAGRRPIPRRDRRRAQGGPA